ncbi:hypothetical protein TPDSL_22740 [Terrisporobacter petrolearius]|uniref:hypothetical protein n=1 Tax=Terrisporobacter petrolearius TaxID=1460447 RepID=UPI0033664156
MFLGTIEIGKSKRIFHESFHDIITEFKSTFNLTIINIQKNDEELEYQFAINYMEEDEAIRGLSHIIISFKIYEDISLVIIKLENKVENFNRFTNMYKKLEEISIKYLKK